MGYFTDINNNDSLRSKGAQYTPVSTRSAQKVQETQYVINTIFGFGFNILPSATDGKGGADSKHLSVDEQKKDLESKLNKCLNKIGAKNADDINEAVSRAQDERDTKIKAAQTEVDAFKNGTDIYSTQIADLKTQLTNSNLTDEEATKIKNKIKKLETKRDKALEKAQNNLDNVIKTENAKVDKICGEATSALSYLEQLASLKSINDNEEVTVQEQTEALNEFATHRNIICSNTDDIKTKQQAAKRIQELVEANPNNKTMQDGYRVIKQQVEDILKNNNLDKYKFADTTAKDNKYYKNFGL